MIQRYTFLEKARNRVFVASVVGITIIVLGALAVWLILFPDDGGKFGPYTLVNILGSTALFAYFPPFVPALLPAALFTRGKTEGAIAGIISYVSWSAFLVTLVSLSSSVQPTECHMCGPGFNALVLTASSVLGLLVGAGGGAIGGWRAKRRKINKQT